MGVKFIGALTQLLPLRSGPGEESQQVSELSPSPFPKEINGENKGATDDREPSPYPSLIQYQSLSPHCSQDLTRTMGAGFGTDNQPVLKLVSEATTQVYGIQQRHELILAKLRSRKLRPVFSSKGEYKILQENHQVVC